MTLRLIEGFDYLQTADFAKAGWVNNSCSIPASLGRRSTRCAGTSNGLSYIYKKLPDFYSSLVVGFAVNIAADIGLTTSIQIAALTDGAPAGGNVQICVRFNYLSRVLEVYRGTTLLAADTLVLALNQYYYVELKVVFHASAGSYELRVAGGTRLSASGISTITTANARANYVGFGVPGGGGHGGTGSSVTVYFDDIYVCDTAGSVNNDFLGDCRVDTLFPTAEGALSDFTPSTGADNALTVDEATINLTDYNSSNVVGHIDTFNMQDLATLADSRVFGVQPVMHALTDEAGSRALASVARVSGSNYETVSTLIGTAGLYHGEVFELNPNGSVSWTQSSVNAAEFGYKIAI